MLSDVKVGDVVRKADGTNFSVSDLPEATVTNVIHGRAVLSTGGHELTWHLNSLPKLITKEQYLTPPTPMIRDIKETSQMIKSDGGKLQWELLLNGCADAVRGVVKVLTVAVIPKDRGGRGYAPNSWKLVPEAERRYRDALFRHIDAVRRGEVFDDGPEGTGEMHVDCIATNALFLSQFEHEKNHARPVPTK